MEKTNLILTGYFIYLPIVLALTFYVSRTLFRNGKRFMLDIFHGQEDIAIATNSLFEVGFYLLNIGFSLFIIKLYSINNMQGLVEALSAKIGGFSIYLGAVLFLNLYLFMRGRKTCTQKFKSCLKSLIKSEKIMVILKITMIFSRKEKGCLKKNYRINATSPFSKNSISLSQYRTSALNQLNKNSRIHHFISKSSIPFFFNGLGYKKLIAPSGQKGAIQTTALLSLLQKHLVIHHLFGLHLEKKHWE